MKHGQWPGQELGGMEDASTGGRQWQRMGSPSGTWLLCPRMWASHPSREHVKGLLELLKLCVLYSEEMGPED